MQLFVHFLLFLTANAVEFQLPKLLHGRLLIAGSDNGAIVTKQRQCFNTQWDFVLTDPLKHQAIKDILTNFCEKIPKIEEFRKEIECDKYRASKVYDYTEEIQKITCNLSYEYLSSPDMFRTEMESIFWFNKISFTFPAEKFPAVWFDAAGYGDGWDMKVNFVQNSMRARPLFCDEDGVMMEVCVPMIHEKMYGDLYQIVDIGSFSPSESEFTLTKLPRSAISTHQQKQIVGIDETKCNKIFEFGYLCDDSATIACNVTTFENCESEIIDTSDNLTIIREIGQFYLINTVEKEYQLTNSSGEMTILAVPSSTFLVAVGEYDFMTLGTNNIPPIQGAHFSHTRTFLISELNEKPIVNTPIKKNILQKWFGFLGKK